jgi:hypothetical protein
VLHATDAARPQRGAVHDERVQLHPAIHVQKRAPPGVEGLVFLHRDHCRLDRIERAAAALQYLPAHIGRSFHAVQM